MGKFRDAIKDKPKHSLCHKAMLVHQKSTVRNILAVEPKLHRISLYGTYLYPELVSRLGSIKVEPTANRKPTLYHSCGFFWLGGDPAVKLTVFFNRIKAAPPCYLEFTCPPNKEKQTLSLLASLLPDLNVSKVEYTVDLVVSHNNPDTVHVLYKFIKRYIDPPFQQKAREYTTEDSESFAAGKATIGRPNRTLYPSSYFKIYERGDDTDKGSKRPKGWSYDQLKLVRLEISSSRHHNKLKQYGIDKLSDLLAAPSFGAVFANKIRFSRAKESTALLPKEWQKYLSKDEQGATGAFFVELLTARKNHPGVRGAVELAQQFTPLSQAIALAAEWFDANWQNPTEPPSIDHLIEDAVIV